MTDKLYLVTRSDLSPGQQAIQAAHAMRQFIAVHPNLDRAWFEFSNTLVLLSVPDEKALLRLLRKAEDRDLKTAVFREPDLNYSVTAVALEPTQASQRLCRNFSLALEE